MLTIIIFINSGFMKTIEFIFGQGTDLTPFQMGMRAVVVFSICLLLIRLSGRRSFGMKTALDNVIAILLGAILSRAVVGASPFFSTIAASVVLVLMHRFLAWVAVYNDTLGKAIKGEARILFEQDKFIEHNMKRSLVSEKDVLESVRLNGNTNAIESIKEIFLERDGQLSIIKKENV
jgi:uncharacterized membrane protein YcaP (DUF421 family)